MTLALIEEEGALGVLEHEVAAAWKFQMCSTISLLGARLGDAGVKELYATPQPVFGDSFLPRPCGWRPSRAAGG